MYGNPDATGAPQGLDPNAPARNVSFFNWIYNGGLFVGNAPPSTMDQSGTGRIQIYPDQTALSGLSGAASMLLSASNLGSPRNFPSGTIDAFSIPSTDPNINWPQATVTWKNAWSISTLNPILGTEPAGTNAYFYWPLTAKPLALTLAVHNEATAIANATVSWNYFQNGVGSTGHPRIWALDGGVTTNSGPYTSWYSVNP